MYIRGVLWNGEVEKGGPVRLTVRGLLAGGALLSSKLRIYYKIIPSIANGYKHQWL